MPTLELGALHAGAYPLDDQIPFQLGDGTENVYRSPAAVDLEPGSALGIGRLGESLTWAGPYERAIPLLKKAPRLNPIYNLGYLALWGTAYRYSGHYQEALAVLKEVTQRQPDRLTARVQLVATYQLLGRESEARLEAAEVLRIRPDFSAEQFANNVPAKDRIAVRSYTLEPLLKAGLK